MPKANPILVAGEPARSGTTLGSDASCATPWEGAVLLPKTESQHSPRARADLRGGRCRRRKRHVPSTNAMTRSSPITREDHRTASRRAGAAAIPMRRNSYQGSHDFRRHARHHRPGLCRDAPPRDVCARTRATIAAFLHQDRQARKPTRAQ